MICPESGISLVGRVPVLYEEKSSKPLIMNEFPISSVIGVLREASSVGWSKRLLWKWKI